ncbi:alpha/beta hydrolase [Alkalinema pantanalense CENA528]|uniref:alpha/beta hydrolase n=1 Tax=Alkalinema pantanalense TaxID=1620705 RepID=UPI003D6E9C23
MKSGAQNSHRSPCPLSHPTTNATMSHRFDWTTWIIGYWSWWRVLRIFLLGYGTIAAYGYFLSDRQMFPAPTPSYTDRPDILKLTTSNQQQISALYLNHPTAQYTLLYSHGNGEDLGSIRPHLTKLNQLGLRIFAYDYRGYGTSQGQPSESATYDDIQTAYNYLTTHLKTPPKKIILMGRSIGSGPSVHLATQKPVAGLILESAFTSIFRVIIPFPVLPFDKFPNRDRLPQVRCPVLIIHGTQDSVIPFHHGQTLYETANPPKTLLTIAGADHNDVSGVGGRQYWQGIQAFQKQLTTPSTSRH